jgi:hypothetical protein
MDRSISVFNGQCSGSVLVREGRALVHIPVTFQPKMVNVAKWAGVLPHTQKALALNLAPLPANSPKFFVGFPKSLQSNTNTT